MKKAVALILAFLYLGLTTGLAVDIHYCMGKIAGVELEYASKAQKCNSCKTQMPCCGDKYQLVKVNDEHQQVAVDFKIELPQVLLNTFSNLIAQLSLPVVGALNTSFIPPPLLLCPDLITQNCVFRI